MQRVCTVVIGMFLAMGLVTGAEAQTVGGEHEVGFFATYSKSTESDNNGFISANARYGVFVTEAIQVGGGVGVSGEVGLEDQSFDELVDVELFGAYYFSPASVNTFYLRAGYFTPLDDFGKGFVDGAFGFKSYLNERTAFFWEGGYGTSVDSDVDEGVIRSVAGITFLF